MFSITLIGKFRFYGNGKQWKRNKREFKRGDLDLRPRPKLILLVVILAFVCKAMGVSGFISNRSVPIVLQRSVEREIPTLKNVDVGNMLKAARQKRLSPSVIEELEWLSRQKISVVYEQNPERNFSRYSVNVKDQGGFLENPSVRKTTIIKEEIRLNDNLKQFPGWLQALFLAKEASYPHHIEDARGLAIEVFKKVKPDPKIYF